MNKELATKLNEKALLIAERFSKNNREGNVNNENFEIKEIIPTSDHTAIVYFKKNTGVIFKFQSGSHDLANCRERFAECDKNGKAVVKKTAKKKGDK